MVSYVAIIHKDSNSDYGVSFPDFPGCITASNTLDNVKDMAQESLAFHIDGMIEDGDAIPDPTTLEDIVNNPEYDDMVAFQLVPVAIKKELVRFNASMDAGLLEQIDDTAKRLGMTRSGYLAELARKEFHQ